MLHELLQFLKVGLEFLNNVPTLLLEAHVKQVLLDLCDLVLQNLFAGDSLCVVRVVVLSLESAQVDIRLELDDVEHLLLQQLHAVLQVVVLFNDGLHHFLLTLRDH